MVRRQRLERSRVHAGTCRFAQEKTCGTGADSNGDSKVRFLINANKTGVYARIDDVEITGSGT
jgi:hypothetical protein